MVEPIKPTSSISPGAPVNKPSPEDLNQVQQITTQIDSLKNAQSLAKKAAALQVLKSRQSAVSLSIAYPSIVQKAYGIQMDQMQNFIEILLKNGDPSWASLLKTYEKDLQQMSHPPTAPEASQLDIMMQLMNSLGSKLPVDAQRSFFSAEAKMYQSMLSTIQPEITHIPPSYIQTFTHNLQFAEEKINNLPNAGNYIQKAVLPMIDTEIEKLRELILFLIRYASPQFRGQLHGYQKQLQKIANSFPDISKDDLNSLTNILGGMNQIADSLPAKSYKATFWNTESDLYNTLAKIGNATSDNNLIIFQAMQDMQGIVKRWQGGMFSPQDFQKLTSDIQELMSNGQVLSYGDSSILQAFLENTGLITGSSFTHPPSPASLQDAVIVALQYSVVQQYISYSGANASLAGLQAFVNGYVNNLPPTSNAALQGMENRLKDITPLITDSSNPHPSFSLATLSKGKMTLNPTALHDLSNNFMTDGLKPPGGNWDGLLEALEGASANFDPTKNGMDSIQNMVQGFEIAAGIAEAKADGVDSLADLFARNIINRYMPEQQGIITNLALVIKFNNLGQSTDQTILNIIKDFSGASGNYLFGSLLGNQNPDGSYAGSATTAKDVLKKEQAAVTSDTAAINKALTQISQDIASLTLNHDYDGDPILSAEKNRLIGQLKSYQASLQTALSQVTQVGKDLAKVRISGDDNAFRVSGLSGHITSDEDYLINGNGSLDPPGGLGKITTDITGDMRDYGNTNTVQSYNMELVLTKVQQEWSLTSTCIATLNHSYMSFAKGIHH